MIYKFKDWLKNEREYELLSGKTDDELIRECGENYLWFCDDHGYEPENFPQLEPVLVAAIKGGQIVTSTSCCRKDAPHYAKYYSSIGYHVKTMNQEQLDKFNEKARMERLRMMKEMNFQ